MATSYTTNALLNKPAATDRHWDAPLNANADFLDGVSSIGKLLVTPAELPSATLNVRVTAGTYVKSDGTVAGYAGLPSYGVPASSTLYLWLTDAGVLAAGPAFPTTPHVRLAHVVSGASAVQGVTDERVVLRSMSASGAVGTSAAPVASGPVGGTFSVVANGSGRTAFFVDPDAPAVGFFGATPAGQAGPVGALVDQTGGTAADAIVGPGASYAPAELGNNFAALTAKVNALIGVLKRHGLMAD